LDIFRDLRVVDAVAGSRHLGVSLVMTESVAGLGLAVSGLDRTGFVMVDPCDLGGVHDLSSVTHLQPYIIQLIKPIFLMSRLISSPEF